MVQGQEGWTGLRRTRQAGPGSLVLVTSLCGLRLSGHWWSRAAGHQAHKARGALGGHSQERRPVASTGSLLPSECALETTGNQRSPAQGTVRPWDPTWSLAHPWGARWRPSSGTYRISCPGQLQLPRALIRVLVPRPQRAGGRAGWGSSPALWSSLQVGTARVTPTPCLASRDSPTPAGPQ